MSIKSEEFCVIKTFCFQITNRTTETVLSLTPVYILVSELYTVLYNCGGQVLYSNLEDIYKKAYNKSLDVSHFGYPSIADFFNAFKKFFILKSYKRKLQLILNKELAGLQTFNYKL